MQNNSDDYRLLFRNNRDQGTGKTWMSIHTSYHAKKISSRHIIDLNIQAKLRKVLEETGKCPHELGAVSAKIGEQKSWQIKIYSHQKTPLRNCICMNINYSSIKLLQKGRREGGGNTQARRRGGEKKIQNINLARIHHLFLKLQLNTDLLRLMMGWGYVLINPF